MAEFHGRGLPESKSAGQYPAAIAVLVEKRAVRVLAHKAKLNGYAVEPEQSSGLSAFSITIHLGPEEK